jgi:hypothetical protein
VPAREEIGGQRDVAVGREPGGQVEGVLNEAVALVKNEHRWPRSLAVRREKHALVQSLAAEPNTFARCCHVLALVYHCGMVMAERRARS